MTDIGLWHDARHNYFANYPADDISAGPLSGVTGVPGVLDKPAILGWAKREVAAAAVREYALLGENIRVGGPDAATKWLSGIPGYQSDIAKDLGSAVHGYAEQVARGGEPDVVFGLRPYVDAYRRFLEDHRPELVSVEKSVANLKHGYGGTFDLLARLDGRLWLLDVKTWRLAPREGSDLYAETAMQLAAYGSAEFIGLANDPKRYAMPLPDAYGVIHLRPDLYQRGYALIPFDVTPREFRAFLACLFLTNWKRDRAKRVVLEPKAVEVAA